MVACHLEFSAGFVMAVSGPDHGRRVRSGWVALFWLGGTPLASRGRLSEPLTATHRKDPRPQLLTRAGDRMPRRAAQLPK
jgi:hypothetical protein